MVGIMSDLYAYITNVFPIEKIISYKETLKRLLAQTTECSYFIIEYQKVTQFSLCLALLYYYLNTNIM